MKIKILLFFFIIIVSFSFSQLNTSKFLVSGKTSLGHSNLGFYGNYGFSFERIFNNRIGAVYNLEGISRKNNFGLHTPMGIAGGPILFAAGIANEVDKDTSTSGTFGIIGGILLFILPDGITYHQNIGYYWDVSPYANLLGLEFEFNDQHKLDALKYACSFGIKTSYLLKDNVFCFGYIETRKTGGYPWGLGVGMGISLSFKKN